MKKTKNKNTGLFTVENKPIFTGDILYRNNPMDERYVKVADTKLYKEWRVFVLPYDPKNKENCWHKGLPLDDTQISFNRYKHFNGTEKDVLKIISAGD